MCGFEVGMQKLHGWSERTFPFSRTLSCKDRQSETVAFFCNPRKHCSKLSGIFVCYIFTFI